MEEGGSSGTKPARWRLGDFEVAEEIGRGGMGVVYRAMQVSMQRPVALKVLPAFAGMDQTAVARFRREAEAAGRLAHPGIVPVYAVGDFDGTKFYAMELIEGPSLDHVIERLQRRRAASLRAPLLVEAGLRSPDASEASVAGDDVLCSPYVRSCAVLAVELANALAVAHAQRIVHRDLKPSNVLVRRTGRPVLVDFGLARDEVQSTLTRSSDALGTPAYMAPEQILRPDKVDARADIWSLGVLLYELLSLRRPFAGSQPGELQRRIVEDDHVSVRRHNPRVPRDLAIIIDTCLAKDPEQRYPAIEAVEIDLRSFLQGRRILARAPGVVGQMARLVRRARRNVLVASASLAAMFVLGLSGVVVMMDRSERQGLDALDEAQRQILELGQPEHAQELYGRAEALLGKTRTRAARLAQARRAFATLYPQRLDVLRDLVAGLSGRLRRELAPEIARLHGRGAIQLVGDLRGVELSMRAVRDGALERDWRPLQSGQELPVGELLLRATAPGCRAHIQGVKIRRDAVTRVDVWPRPEDQVGADMVPVVTAREELAFALQRTELSVAAYRALLDELRGAGPSGAALRADSGLADELVPLGFDDALEGDLPIRGLSFPQGRAVVALLGGHLPLGEELALAGHVGLEAFAYPWGGAFESHRLIADPRQAMAPAAVDVGIAGASPLGVLHLLGNVAELVAPSSVGGPAMAGGHFQSLHPDALRLRPLFAVPVSLTERSPASRFAGLRLARFLPLRDTPAARDAAARAWRGLGQGAAVANAYEWELRATGEIDLTLTLTGFRNELGESVFDFGTSGFLQEGPLEVTDGHRRPLSFTRERQRHRESSLVRVVLPAAQRGARYRVRLSSQLLGCAGLRLDDQQEYRLALPMKAPGQLAAGHRLRLPRNARLTAVDPKPAATYVDGGCQYLQWIWSAGGPPRVLPAVVRFRCDGMLTPRWPAQQPVKELARRWLAAGEGGADAAVLTHEAFFGPMAADRNQPRQRWRFGPPECGLASAVGPVLTVGLRADWHLGPSAGGATLRRWPLELQLLRVGGAPPQALRLRSALRSDDGVFDATGRYWHERLRTAIDPGPQAQLNATSDELTELQVVYVHPDHPAVRLQILGHFAADEDDATSVYTRLTRGAVALHSGTRLSRSHAASVFEPSLREDWEFEGSGRWSRECWWFRTRGRRTLLCKGIALGQSRDGANVSFGDASAWFDAKLATVRFD